MRSSGHVILFFLILFGTQACLKVKSYPDTPSIKVLSTTFDNVDIKSTIHFTDGDGDIGLGAGDTTGAFTGRYTYNFFATCYIDTDGVWQKYGVETPYRIQPITPKGKIKVLEGEIEVTLFPSNLEQPHKLKYAFTLVDRALHESNVAETEAITINP